MKQKELKALKTDPYMCNLSVHTVLDLHVMHLKNSEYNAVDYNIRIFVQNYLSL